MKIFIVNGAGGSGKTTFERMVENVAEQEGYDIRVLSTINYVKGIAKQCGWNGEKTLNDRRFLSDLKDALTRWKDVPYQFIKKQIDHLNEDIKADAVFIDCREPEEIARFVKDDNVKNYQYDIVIDNSRGLDELNQEAQIFIETWLGEDDD